ncbi:MAG: sigma-70 family RNA polymerase sigma factor [Bacteroidota bacterium]
MQEKELIPHLFRTEYSKLVAVLCKVFGLTHIELAEDIVSDTFLLASESWEKNGIPDKQLAWLYTVAKNRTRDYLRRNKTLQEKILPNLREDQEESYEIGLDMSEQNIQDSMLRMIFAVCHPRLSKENQVILSLRILCGFGIEEIAHALLAQKASINKRLYRAKKSLRDEKVDLVFPTGDISERLDSVLTSLYLLFNEGYYSNSGAENFPIKKDLCLEAMRLVLLLLQHKGTARPQVFALLALMCFQASRLEARRGSSGELLLYEEQNRSLWNQELIQKGEDYLNLSSGGDNLSKYHLEAAIAYWHTVESDEEKWENILQLYNYLLQLEYSPITALNRTYALAKANKPEEALKLAKKLEVPQKHLYHALLGDLYIMCGDKKEGKAQWEMAFSLAKSQEEKNLIMRKIQSLN